MTIDGSHPLYCPANTPVHIPGNFALKLISADAETGVTITFFDTNKRVLATIDDIKPGIKYGPVRDADGKNPRPFDSAEVVSPVNQNIVVLLFSADFDYDRAVGDVAITGGQLDTLTSITDPVNIGNFPAVQSIAFNGTQNVAVPAGVNVNNHPTGFNVNNFPTGFNVNNQPDVTAEFYQANRFSTCVYTGVVSGRYPAAQLWNNSGSTILVDRCWASCNETVSVVIGLFRIASQISLTATNNNKTDAVRFSDLAVTSTPGIICKAGTSTAGVFSSSSTSLMAEIHNSLYRKPLELIRPEAPVRIPTGKGIALHTAQTGVAFYSTFHFQTI